MESKHQNNAYRMNKLTATDRKCIVPDRGQVTEQILQVEEDPDGVSCLGLLMLQGGRDYPQGRRQE